MLFTWFMLAGLIFLFAPQGLTNKFQFTFARIFRWPLGISRNIALYAQTRQSPKDVVSRREYNRLQNHLANVLEQRDQELQKVEVLSKLRYKHGLQDAKFVLADVIRAFIDGSHGEFIINRGKNDGLAEGQFVLGFNSIIGTVSDAGPHIARIKLIVDPTSKIEVKIADTDRVMQGNGSNSAKLKFFPAEKKIEIGDYVYTCKKPGFLNYPMIIARVAEIEPDEDNPLSRNITVEPACRLERLSNVAVIIMNPQE